MKAFDSKTYSVNDFREWNDRGQLQLDPRFQRRDVWTDKARSFLMDTIIRGKPIPKVFIRQKTDVNSRQTVREVVDGQQRLRTILRYLDNGFAISPVHNKEYGGLLYGQLDEEAQRSILEYELSVDILLGAADQDVLDIFARLNSYAVTLNQQERLNARYFGEFKQAVYELSIEYSTFWRSLPFMTDQAILRMSEAEQTSDLLIAMAAGIRPKKAIPRFYEEFDDAFPKKIQLMERFRDTLDLVGELMAGHNRSNFMRRIHLFYTLVCSTHHMLFGISNLQVERMPIRRSDFPKILTSLERIDTIFERPEESLDREERLFLTDSRRATTDEPVRIRRSVFTCQRMLSEVTRP
jgi:hypothetical protein